MLLVLTGLGVGGGAERSTVELVPHLVERGVRVTVAFFVERAAGAAPQLASLGVDVRHIPEPSLLRRARSLRKLIRELQPDLVHTALIDADLAGRIASWGTGIPLVNSLVNTPYERSRLSDPALRPWRVRLVQVVDAVTAHAFVDHFHAISAAAKDSAVRHLRLRPESVTVVWRGRSGDRFTAAEAIEVADTRAELGVPLDAPLIVNVGRQVHQKGHDVLVRAFVRVLEQHPEARLVIAGEEGPATAGLVSLIESLDVSGRVSLVGYRPDAPVLVAAADVFAFPSRYEGFGAAPVEAMALGRAIVASDIPVIREVVGADAAVLVPPDDPGALADALVSVLGDPVRREQLGASGRVRFAERYTSDANAAAMLELYCRVAAS
ncbi:MULTISPECIES: glycosyltransferase family 4 protein [unclassified Blastococcus]